MRATVGEAAVEARPRGCGRERGEAAQHDAAAGPVA